MVFVMDSVFVMDNGFLLAVRSALLVLIAFINHPNHLGLVLQVRKCPA
jgi:hypothetical protein